MRTCLQNRAARPEAGPRESGPARLTCAAQGVPRSFLGTVQPLPIEQTPILELLPGYSENFPSH